MGELLVILVIVLLIFGAGKLPQIGDALGQSIRNFKKAANGGDQKNQQQQSQQQDADADAPKKPANSQKTV
jgi:sec-independent protein translocase protein TatA